VGARVGNCHVASGIFVWRAPQCVAKFPLSRNQLSDIPQLRFRTLPRANGVKWFRILSQQTSRQI
jgi:hypothetical protein